MCFIVIIWVGLCFFYAKDHTSLCEGSHTTTCVCAHACACVRVRDFIGSQGFDSQLQTFDILVWKEYVNTLLKAVCFLRFFGFSDFLPQGSLTGWIRIVVKRLELHEDPIVLCIVLFIFNSSIFLFLLCNQRCRYVCVAANLVLCGIA